MNKALRLICVLGLLLGAAAPRAAITGSVETIAGYGPGFANGGNFDSKFNMPMGLAVDGQNRLFVADYLNNAIRIVDVAKEETSTFTTLGVNGPSSVAIDNSGRILVANFTGGNVRRYDPSGQSSAVVVAGLVNPVAVALDGVGNIYVALQGGEVRRYNSASGALERSYFVTAGATTRLSGLAIANDGQVVVSDSGNHVLWRFAVLGGSASLYAGTLGGAGFADGPVNTARFNSPQHIAVSANGIIVVADRLNHRVRAVNDVGTVSTLYGIDPDDWSDPTFPGWTDGAAEFVELRDPVGITSTPEGVVFDSEDFYHIIHKATGLTFPTNSVANSTNTPPPVKGLNLITLGFDGGEGSSDFIGAPGQHFYAPITLTVAQGQKMYGLQFNMTITNRPGAVANANYGPTFNSLLMMPVPPFYFPIPPAAFVSNRIDIFDIQANSPLGIITVRVTNIVPILKPLEIRDGPGRFYGVGWLERYPFTNLYPSVNQDLITFSGAHNRLFRSVDGKVIVGAWGVNIPGNAVIGSQYEMQIGRPSANSDGIDGDVNLESPQTTNNISRSSGLRNLTVGIRPYLVGDTVPFRWYNAGDFGDNNILNNDLEDYHQIFAYNLNDPPDDSDMWNAYDSCCQDINHNPVVDPIASPGGHQTTANAVVNSIAHGDGVLNLADLYVSFRRSLDPSLSNYIRFWSNGVLQAVAITNGSRGDATSTSVSALSAKSKIQTFDVSLAEEPIQGRIFAESRAGKPGQVVRLPIKVEVSGPLTAQSVLFRVAAVSRDENVPLTKPISFTPNISLGAPSFGGTVSSNAYYAGWFERVAMAESTYEIGTVDVTIPANATPDTLIELRVERAELSSGLTTFEVTSQNGYVFLENRARAPWSDQIPDSWRIQYFGSLMDILSSPEADADGDGMTNLQEYNAGTNPNDILSRFTLRGQDAGVEPSLILSWPSVTGKSYRLLTSEAVVGAAWTTVEDQIPGTGAQIQRLRPRDSKNRFYRVLIIE